MTLSTSFSNKMLPWLLAGTFLFSGCAGVRERVAGEAPQAARGFTVAVFPLENLSATAAPLKELRQNLVDQLRERGFRVMDEEAFQKFMAGRRIRYTGGLDAETAAAFRKEAGVDGVLVTEIGLFSEVNPPKFALTSRLVSTGEKPAILWMKTVGMAGDDSPGILGIGMIYDPKVLEEKVEGRIVESLADYFAGKKEAVSIPRKFRPKVSFRSPVLDPKRTYTIAVVPFYNRSDRKYAAELMALQFIEHLRETGNFTVVEPGLIRDQLLKFRLILMEGVSIPNAEVLFENLNTDLILTGSVLDYEDYQGSYGKPKVEFSVSLLERKSKEVVWSSNSYNTGDDGVFFFDCGRVNTASVMASRMTRAIVDMMTK